MSVNTDVAPRICGRKIPSSWPKTWLSGKQVKEPQRMDKSFVAAVSLDFFLDGLEIGEQVSVGEHDAARLGGGAGGEYDFDSGSPRLARA